ncbi:MAG: hypothetical protein EOS58_17300 [Mesorhizobium sp.]|uniref:hypothetical protein n=1 Tax=unclassified Mesorhizobium TaxID=325217 RepID=UPI000F75AB24|nr:MULTISPECIES: hypothetical protein [unclassified Mesorhizobium]RVD69803.1 hypothetical protein EN751_24065 [Mesorhizobium sp. M4A.F.Ca.ET.029.04.2.1]AZO46658.1 hypothetical protein EJ073_01715 [Mesorhizobium sp. M4B.F.Ca.ET.058.02.1.1]RUX46613.1 hypothetical protein EOA33_20710 [Mesorhizobium sp. M4A.F.Ca.ET.050.02.1.1]RVC41332.1 hypothetical protein EN781_26455 [Mesorhizobium sp. M4A.F.Ca.ET.090.04.2.1]RVD44247.1 hypothetical protein EN742_02850 [Mesorhizobium sp. M4A.F.Ca.ET.020.02.1.1]
MTSLTGLLRLLTLSLAAAPAWAQSSPVPQLNLELNAAQPSDKGCRLTFVVNNALGADLSKTAFEIALFNEAGVVDRLTVLDFKDLPVSKTKVTRFDLAGTDCAKVSRVLINSATECAGASVEPAACMRGLKTSTRTTIAFGV